MIVVFSLSRAIKLSIGLHKMFVNWMIPEQNIPAPYECKWMQVRRKRPEWPRLHMCWRKPSHSSFISQSKSEPNVWWGQIDTAWLVADERWDTKRDALTLEAQYVGSSQAKRWLKKSRWTRWLKYKFFNRWGFFRLLIFLLFGNQDAWENWDCDQKVIAVRFEHQSPE